MNVLPIRFLAIGRGHTQLFIFLFCSLVSALHLSAQCPVTASPFRVGLFNATIPVGLTCPSSNPAYINWGDLCTNPVPTNAATFHQYQTCGTYKVTIGCLGGTPICTTTLILVMPSLVITQSQSVIPGNCGNEVELTLNIGNDPSCGGSFGEKVTISGAIPTQFDITGGNITHSGQNFNLVIDANTLPNSPASTSYTLRVKPKYCTSTSLLALTLNVSVPNGYGLGNNLANCSDIISPPTDTLPTNPRDYKFFITPQVPCIQLTKTTSTPNIQPGGTAVFQVTVRNTGNLFSGNNFNGGHTNALRLGTSGMLGTQDHRGNQWFSSATGWQALNDGGFPNAQNSIFNVSAGSYTPFPRNPATGWFAIDDAGESNCTDVCGSLPNDNLGDLDQRVAANSFYLPNHQAGTLWSLQRQLYRRLTDRPDLVMSGSVYQSFVTTQSNGLVGKLTDVERGIEAVYTVSATDQARWQAILARWEVLGENMAIKDSLLRQVSDSQSATLLTEKTGLQNEYDSIHNVLTIWWSGQVVQRDQQLATLVTQNNTLSTGSNTQARNEQLVNRILLSRKLIQNRNLSSQDYSDLTSIALQCALDGGAAVHQARGILDWAQDTMRIWQEPCGNNLQNPGEDRNDAVQAGSSRLFLVFPNPTSEELMVQCPEMADQILTATLYNPLGQSVLKTQFTGPSSSLSLKPLPSGVYWLTIREKGRLVHEQAVVKN